jgi:transposase
MNEQTVRKTYKYKLSPTPTQERELGRGLGLCRSLDNTALEQRITAYLRRHVVVLQYQQEAELRANRAESPEYAAIHRHALQDALVRLDKTYQAFFSPRGREGGLSTLPGPRSLPLVHLQGGRQWGHAPQWLFGPR